VREALGARIAVRLEQHGHRPSEAAGHGHDRPDLGRVMAVVVDDQHAAVLAVFLAAPAHAGAALEPLRDARERDLQLQAHGHGGQRVLQVVAAAQLQAKRTQLAAEGPDHGLLAVGVLDDGAGIGAHLGLARQPVCDRLALDQRQQRAHLRVVHAHHARAVERYAQQELLERRGQRFEVGIVVDVFEVDVRHHRHCRRQVQERSVALVGLGHQVRPGAQHGARAHRPDLAADDHRRVQPAGLEDRGDQRRGGRLAVAAGDRDPVLQAHQLGQHLGAADDRQARRARGHDLAVGLGHGRRTHDDIGAADVVRRMADVDARPQLLQPIGRRRPVQVAAADGEAEVQQHLGDAAHADAADGYQVDMPCIAEQTVTPGSGRVRRDRRDGRPEPGDHRR
jgi:hypothetical protein